MEGCRNVQKLQWAGVVQGEFHLYFLFVLDVDILTSPALPISSERAKSHCPLLTTRNFPQQAPQTRPLLHRSSPALPLLVMPIVSCSFIVSSSFCSAQLQVWTLPRQPVVSSCSIPTGSSQRSRTLSFRYVAPFARTLAVFLMSAVFYVWNNEFMLACFSSASVSCGILSPGS